MESTNGITKIEIYKDDDTTPLKKFTYSNEKSIINKFFLVTENGKYTVKVYSKLTAKKSINITDIPQILYNFHLLNIFLLYTDILYLIFLCILALSY